MIQVRFPLQVVREYYSHFARKEATLRVIFTDGEITLNIPDGGLVTEDGWRITPLSHPTVSMACMDHALTYTIMSIMHTLYSDPRSPGRMQITLRRVGGSLSVS